MCVTLENAKYLTRADLRAMGWDQVKIQAFSHDKTMKSETGRGRPSYLYLESRVLELDGKATIEQVSPDRKGSK